MAGRSRSFSRSPRPVHPTTGTDPASRPTSRRASSSTTLDGAVALTWTDNSYTSDPGQLPELPHLQHDLRPRSYDLVRHQLPARGNHGGAGVHRRRAGQRRAALLHRDGGERGRVRERPLAAAVGHAPSRHAEHRALRVPVSDDREAASGSGTISTATARCRDAELGLVRDGRGRPTSTSWWIGTASGDCSSLRCAPAPASSTTTTNNPVEDLTSIDFAAGPQPTTRPGSWRCPGIGYIFEMDGGDGFKRYGARAGHPRGPGRSSSSTGPSRPIPAIPS